MVGLGFLLQAAFGTDPVFDGLACAPVAGQLAVTIAPGAAIAVLPLDPGGFGGLAATQSSVVALGSNAGSTQLALVAPATAGTSQTSIVQARVIEQDTAPVVLPYWNAANPSVPYAGPNNSGGAQATQRIQSVQLAIKPGAVAPTGQQTVPSADAGWVALYAISLHAGDTQIAAQQIAQVATAPFIGWKIPRLRPGFPQRAVLTQSQTFSVPAGVSLLRVRMVGGGGGGGGCSAAGLGGGGGGAAGYGEAVVSVQPGQQIFVTVGAGGTGVTSGLAGWGGTSSFGPYVSATGGAGGDSAGAGGLGGYAYGADAAMWGGCGCDGQSSGFVFPGAGGASAFGGGGRGSNGGNSLMSGQAYGSGAGGCYLTPGAGGNGAPGVVIVEY